MSAHRHRQHDQQQDQASTSSPSATRANGSHGYLASRSSIQTGTPGRMRRAGRLIDRRKAGGTVFGGAALTSPALIARQQIVSASPWRSNGSGRMRRPPGRSTRRIAVEVSTGGTRLLRLREGDGRCRPSARGPATGAVNGEGALGIDGGQRREVALVPDCRDTSVASWRWRIFWFAASTSPICCQA